MDTTDNTTSDTSALRNLNVRSVVNEGTYASYRQKELDENEVHIAPLPK